MSPAAQEIKEAVPSANGHEETLLMKVASGEVTARMAAQALTPGYMDRSDSGVLKIEHAAIEDLEFYKDCVREYRRHDRNTLISSAVSLRRLWDRE